MLKSSFVAITLAALPTVAQANCTATFGFLGDAEVSGVVVEVHYARSGVTFVGQGDSVDCRSLQEGVLATFNDEADVITAALIRVEPFGGDKLFSCTISNDVDPGRISVETVDASDADSNPVSRLPEAALVGIECEGDVQVVDETQYCDVVFSVDTPQRLSGLVFEAKYGGAEVDPVGVGDAVACKTLLPNGLGAYNDEEADLSLIGALVHVQGVQGTADLAKCRFEAPHGLTSMDLDIGVSDAVGPTGEPLSKTPTVFVGELNCGTAATLGGSGDDDEPAEDCDGNYEVTFAVGGGARLGALQVGVNYSAASGLFVGAGEAVQCSADVNGLAMFNDKDGFKTLNAGLIATGGFQAPHDVFTCEFEGIGRAPTVADFAISVQDASTVEGTDVSPVPGVHVSAIAGGPGNECGEPAPECGNGIVEADEECDDADLDEQDGCLSNCAEATCGDIDGNGSVTATDAKRVLNVAVGLAIDCSLVRCDVNSTGSVTATDARMILNESVGLDVPLDCSWALIAGL